MYFDMFRYMMLSCSSTYLHYTTRTRHPLETSYTSNIKGIAYVSRMHRDISSHIR